MNPKTEKLPGLRQPTGAEKTWIAESWCPEVERVHSPKAGKLVRYIGIFLTCTGVVSLIRGDEGITNALVLLVAAAICLFFSAVGKKSARDYKNRLSALQAGAYQVAPAMSTKVWSGFSGNNPNGYVQARLADGEKLSGSFPIPYVCADPLLRQKIHEVPVLLIVIPGDPEILAIPVQK